MVSEIPDALQTLAPILIFVALVEVIAGRLGWVKANYDFKESIVNLILGGVNSTIWLARIGVYYALGSWLYQYRIFEIGNVWWAFILIFFIEDFLYYCFHRFSHTHRYWWAAHVTHHSSRHLNIIASFRLTSHNVLVGEFLFAMPLAVVGFTPEMIVFQKGLSLIWQGFVHTEAIGKLPASIEWFFNTPSHHRVHHGCNEKYLDRNYAGTLIIWDRMFGSFEPEDPNEPCRFGLVEDIGTYNPLRVLFHELIDMVRDIAEAKSSYEAWMYFWGPPGWRPERASPAERPVGGD